MNCPRCGKDTTQDGVWPIESGGTVVGGCHECFESDCDELWWQIAGWVPWWKVPCWWITRLWRKLWT